MKKCFFFDDRVNYLSQVISMEKLSISNKGKDAIEIVPQPVYRIPPVGPRLARISSRLKKANKKSSLHFDGLEDVYIEAQLVLQENLFSPQLLALPDLNGRHKLYIDTCNKQIGFVLRQEQPDGPTKPFRYWS